jgi:hypothetical protein
MQTSLTYSHVEWHALAARLTRSAAPELSNQELPAQIINSVDRSWLMGHRIATIELDETDAAVLIALRADLPDIEFLSVIAEADRIIRKHQRRHARR